MTTDEQIHETNKERCLRGIREGNDMASKLMWQNIYFWFLKNNLLNAPSHD